MTTDKQKEFKKKVLGKLSRRADAWDSAKYQPMTCDVIRNMEAALKAKGIKQGIEIAMHEIKHMRYIK